MLAQSALDSTEELELSTAQPLPENKHALDASRAKEQVAKERAESTTPWGESPELLRYRADILMDEMMLGAIDVYAGEPKATGFSTHMPAHASSAPATYPQNGHEQDNYENSAYKSTGDYTRSAPASYEDGSQANRTSAAYQKSASPISIGTAEVGLAASAARSTPERATPASPMARPLAEEARNQASAEASNREPKAWIFSAEARYQQIARNQQVYADSTPLVDSDNVHTIPPLIVASPQAQPWMAQETHTPTASVASMTGTNSGQSSGVAEPELGPVRRTAQPAGAMSTPNRNAANRNGKWSNLLPRMSSTDVQTLQQEIVTLHSEIGAILPASHEACQRAHHLLGKAQAILQSDPMRSAEVEYYLQQVRTIFQRLQQTIHWSNIYRNRLLVYLTGWSGLAAIVIIACYMYQAQIAELVQTMSNLTADSIALQHVASALCTLFAGGLGGALGALLNLRLRSKLEHGFFDRKYGLRGLILPLMGALFGAALYLLVGFVYFLASLDPSASLGLSTLPALLAFAFGISQETIYGTRE